MNYQTGTSMAKLAKDYRVNRATISDLLKRLCIPIREQQHITDGETTDASQLYGEGWSLAHIANWSAETSARMMRAPHHHAVPLEMLADGFRTEALR